MAWLRLYLRLPLVTQACHDEATEVTGSDIELLAHVTPVDGFLLAVNSPRTSDTFS